MMTKRTGETKKRDYSCEIISLIVTVILSELSHFWYIVFASCFATLCWGSDRHAREIRDFRSQQVFVGLSGKSHTG